MKYAQTPDHIGLNALINRLKEGRFAVPDFQREFEWQPWDIRELMRSIFLDYYIGSLLLWKGKPQNFEALSCEPVYGYDGKPQREYIVLDGQQRLTAIHYAFLAPNKPLPNRANAAFYFIRVDRFMDEEYDKAFEYEWRTFYWNKVFTSPEMQYEQHIFPLSVIGRGGFDLARWVQGYEKYWQDKAADDSASGSPQGHPLAAAHVENATAFGDHVQSISQDYQISYIELDQDLELDKVCDIFTKLNSTGVRLDVFDLINALLRPKGLALKERWRDAARRLDFVDTERMNVYILQVMSILLQAYCSPKYLYFLLPGQEKPIRNPDGSRHTEVLIETTDEFEKRWDRAVGALEGAIKLLRQPQEFGAIRSDYLPYASILPVFSSLQAYVGTIPANDQLDAQSKVRHWYWASVFTNRYSGSVESTSARDFLDVKAWIADDAAEPALLADFKSRFKNLELRREVRRGTSVYNGEFNLLVIRGARDWITGKIPLPEDLDDHHIVPAFWCSEHLDPTVGNTILNRSPLTADTNRKVIRDRLPNEYLPELMAAGAHSGQRVRDILESHFISPAAQAILMRDPFTSADFEEFIAERQRTIQEAIENLLIKGRLDLSPALRDLDERIEQVELKLRLLVFKGLNGSAGEVPSHIAQTVDDRIRGAAKKDPAMDVGQYETPKGKLEYFDLRELQATITNKLLWPRFQGLFNTQEALSAKFDQLAELRNGIRHSRSINNVVKMEGEAAILWFEQLLSK